MVVASLTASIAVLAGASSALATPSGEFAQFADCPFENPEVSACVVAKAEGGKFTIGNRTVPIEKTITLQGGLEENEAGETVLVEAVGGETLSKTPQKVPGGLTGIEGLGGEVTATTELAGPASSVVLNSTNLLFETGTALSLPVKLKLGNPFLGSKCYGASNEHPIVLNLTTGTTSPPAPNKPIKGKRGTLTTNEEGTILTITENSLVNNSFAAPGVNGCGFYPPLIDPLVNLGFGVPAGEGHNTAILTGKLQIADASAVKENSEKS